MPIKHFPEEHDKFELQAYKKPKSLKLLKQTHIAFTGSPRKHPYDPDRVILITDPYSKITSYYEFKTADVSYVEELVNLVNMDGETAPMAIIWVKKKSIGARASLFIVDDTTL
ncbi:MAG: inorganic pyrophosphatase Ppa [Desulfobulbaceae bacterium]|nr:inorganic pyrophosphatase Ppa [Desulfobulbaceae bacterium]